ncbi:hypothetical protein ZWY2020_011821 [Hordeum vulgare]|nr:hypothetical protein ZWY2020_011821 [Hordeum vulgare]
MVHRRITMYAMLTPERRMHLEAEIQARRAARIAVGQPPDSLEPEEEQPKEELSKPMEEDEADEDKEDQPAPGLNMAEADAEFVITQAKEIAEHQDILDSIQDEAEVLANCRLIRQRRAEADALFYELDAEIAAEKAAKEHPKA